MANRASVVFDPAATSPARLIETIRSSGYDALLPRLDAPTPKTSPPGALSIEASGRAWVTLAAGAAAMLLAMPLDSGMGPLGHSLMRLTTRLYAIPPSLLRWSCRVECRNQQ